jgi:hypothetical protein
MATAMTRVEAKELEDHVPVPIPPIEEIAVLARCDAVRPTRRVRTVRVRMESGSRAIATSGHREQGFNISV